MTIKLIVGIGNIGIQYRNTRHNFGHKYIQSLAKEYSINLKKDRRLLGYIGKLKIFDFTTKLLIPDSYINRSGFSVSKCINYYHISPQEILIAHDDLDLSPGTIRIKLGTKVHTSHNGLKDIIEKLNENFDFYRLRIGIGRPKNKNEIVNFVLSKPSIFEDMQINSIINTVISYTEDIVLGNFNKVMNNLSTYMILNNKIIHYIK